MAAMETFISVAETIGRVCASHGVRRAYGVPGGGSSLDLIDAFARCGIAFHLCRTETGAVLMAAADAEVGHGIGVAIATQGPGAASAMNGLAHASLDRAPVLFISDGWTPAQRAIDSHQVFEQAAMSQPVVRAASRLESDEPAAELEAVIAAMRKPPWGPAHVVLTGDNARRRVAVASGSARALPPRVADTAASIDRACRLLAGAERPVLLVGLEAREEGAAAQIAALAERLACPVLTTYKAKGLVSDESPWLVGHFTGGALERECVGAADLIVLCGLDPVELIGRPWAYRVPVLDIALVRRPVHYMQPAAELHGDLALHLDALRPAARPSRWPAPEIAACRRSMSERLAYRGSGSGLTPQQVVEMALASWPGPARPAITVDAGAHMFSAMGCWRAVSPGGALISNGLATMGFALPAGIARSLARPELPTIAFTGDGGLMMCLGELATAAEVGARLCVIVFNDASLSLIALKQRNRGLAEAGVGWRGAVDFAAIARGFGIDACTAGTADQYAQALRRAGTVDGPTLIDVRVDPSGYRAQAQALRG